ncbi:MAG: hypothetical protein AAAFM81_12870 [Pseudomonadota bacterium]
MKSRYLTLLTLTVFALVALPSNAYANECEWKGTSVERAACFLEVGKASLAREDSHAASSYFLEGLRCIGNEYLAPPIADNAASKLLASAAFAATSGDLQKAATLRMTVLDDALQRAQAE